MSSFLAYTNKLEQIVQRRPSRSPVSVMAVVVMSVVLLFHDDFSGREHFAVAGNGVEIHAV